MELNFFKKNKVKKIDLLTIDSTTYTSSDIVGGVNYEQNVNSGTDLNLGSCTTAMINFELNNQNQLISDLASKEIIWIMRVYTDDETYEDIQMGIFIAEKPTRVNDTRMRVKAYDRMIRFDVIVDDWIASLTYPITLKEYLISLCARIGVTLATKTFLNEGYVIQDNFAGTNVKGRRVLQWIGEIAVKYVIINEYGQLKLGWYTDVEYEITNSDYYSVSVEDYQTKHIDKVQVKIERNDIGVVVGTGTNAYVIENNPLLYAETDAEIRPTVENIYNAIKDISYYPFSIKGNINPLLKAGNIITIKTRNWDKYLVDNLLMTVDEMLGTVDSYNSGQVIKGVIMNRKMTGGIDTYSATGNIDRSINVSINESIVRLRGRANVLERTIDATISKLYDTETGDISILTQTAESLSTRITDAEDNVTEILLTTDGITAAVNASKLTFDETGLTIKNGGFRILDVNDEILLSSEGGHLEIRAYLKTGTETGATYIDNTGIYFVNDTAFGSEIRGGAGLSLSSSTSISLDAPLVINLNANTSISLNAIRVNVSGNLSADQIQGRSCSWKGFNSLDGLDSVLTSSF